MENSTLYMSNISDAINCSPTSIKQFPSDLFTNHQRKQGAILLHIGAALYMFGVLVYLCDEYFMPALEFIVDKYKIKADIAGATFMAIGSSSPELFTSMTGVFITKDDVGLGAIVGSAVFNTLFVIGCCVCVAPPGAMKLQIYPVMRDSCCYVLALIPLEIVCWDQHVSWYDAVILVVLYAGFVLLMYVNENLERRIAKCFLFIDNKDTDNYNIEDDESPILSPKDGVICQFGESDQESYIDGRTSQSPHGHSRPSSRNSTKDGIKNNSHSRPLSRNSIHDGVKDYGALTSLDAKYDDSWHSVFVFPDGTVSKIVWLLGLPVIVCFALTIPNPKKDCFKKLVPVTFIMSLFYTGLASYLLVWMVSIIGYTIGIPDIIIGLVLLSAGASLPDAVGSIIATRHGQGGMAIGNCIGSNIFDILIGLGLPWLIKTTVYGTTIKIYSETIHVTILILLGSVITLNIIFIASRWSPRWPAGLALLIFYVGFITLACLFEMNVLEKLNMPTCI